MTEINQMIEKIKGMPSALARILEKWLKKLPKVRKEIAQIKTALKEYEIGIRKIEGT